MVACGLGGRSGLAPPPWPLCPLCRLPAPSLAAWWPAPPPRPPLARQVFAGSAVLGPWLPLAAFPDYMSVPFSFALNGAVVQTGVGSEMTTHPGPAVDLAAALFPLLPGDLLFTGTPAGVGPVVPGDAGTLAWGDRLSYSVKFR